MDRLHSIAELLEYIERNYHKEQAFAEKGENGWVYLSHHEFLLQVKAVALFLHSIGIEKGSMVGILAIPGIRWTVVDLAIMSIGAITVPLFANISEENFVFECTQTNLKTLFVLGQDQWKMYENNKDLFERVIDLSTSYEAIVEQGKKMPPKHFEVHENDVATIIYTSGSTGVPKGAVLTHKNLVSVTYHNPFALSGSDRFLSLLPLAHIFARTVNLIMMRWNVSIYYFNELKEVAVACKEIMPTAVVMVPRLLERIYAKLVARIDEASFLKKSIGHWAFSIALHAKNIKHLLLHPLADQAVFKTIRAALGNHLRLVVSGGAPLNPLLCHFYNEIGIPIYEGYGMTEASIVAYNTPELSKEGTIGRADPEVEVKISEEGELLVRADIVFQGYYKNPEKTAKALDSHGWLHTGDKAAMDPDGFLTIQGRMEELVKTSTGEWVAEVPLEQELSRAPFVEFAMVVAERRKFVSALIFPNFEVVSALKKAQNLEALSDEEFLQSDYIQQEMKKLLEEINTHHNHWEQIRDFRFVLKPATIETGELTPTLKIRRGFVEKKYRDLIESMY